MDFHGFPSILMDFRGSGVIMLEDLGRPDDQAVAPIETFPPSWLAGWLGWLAGLAGWLAGWARWAG